MQFKNLGLRKIIILLYLLTPLLHFAQTSINDFGTLNPEYNEKTVDSLYLQSRRLYRVNPDSALVIGNKMLQLSDQLDYQIGIAKAKEAIARAAMFKKSDSLSFKKAFDAFEFSKKIGADSVLLETINILGFGSYRNKRIDKVYEFNSLGRKYAKEFGHFEKSFVFMSNAASIMVSLNEFDRAFKFFDQSIMLLKKQPDDYKFTQLYIEIANAYYESGLKEKAEEFNEIALGYLAKIKAPNLLLKSYILEANLLIETSKFDEAKKVLEKADLLITQLSNQIGKAKIYLAYARIAFFQRDFHTSKTYIDTGLMISKSSNYFDGQLAFLELLYLVNQHNEDFQSANEYIERYYVLKDSLNLIRNQNRLRIALVENDFQKEQEILSLTIEQSRTKQRSIILIAFLVILFLVTGFFLIKRNADSLKILNLELAQRQKELEDKTSTLNHANKTKDKLFSIIGHDLKGPITNVQMLLRLYIDEGISNKKFVEHLPRIKSKIDHILFSLNNLLTWGITQLKGETVNFSYVNILEKANNAIKLLGDNALGKGIKLSNTIAEDAHVWADANHLEIILRNLLSNAIKFTPSGGRIFLSAKNEGFTWKICIQDTGVGISDKKLKEIFENRISESDYGTNKERGTGLGLNLCRDMIALNKGDIVIESELKKGTKVFVKLPMDNPELQ